MKCAILYLEIKVGIYMERVCLNCGAQIKDDSVQYCPNCGKVLGPKGYNSGLLTAAQIFMIISCVSIGWTLIPLIWLIPMTCKISARKNNGEKLSTGFKVCTLIFGNTVAGILLLCDDQA